jgi:hypothetical protein
MANLSKTTQDHEEIRRWAEERGGKPSHVKSTGSAEDVGILRIDFPGYSGEGSLEEISWEDWFDKFDEGNLALLYEETTSEGQKSNFNKIVSAETAAANEQKSGRSAARKKGTASKKKAASPAKKSASGASRGAAAKTVTKKAATKKAATKTASKAAKKGPVATKRTSGKKVAAKKAAPSKTSAKKAPAKKVAAKKAAPAKKAIKKSAAKKTATKKRR